MGEKTATVQRKHLGNFVWVERLGDGAILLTLSDPENASKRINPIELDREVLAKLLDYMKQFPGPLKVRQFPDTRQ